MDNSLAKQVTDITTDFLGPAAERFINRQIAFHLKKTPEELTREDIPKLTEWIRVSLAMLTNDRTMVDNCINKITQLQA